MLKFPLRLLHIEVFYAGHAPSPISFSFTTLTDDEILFRDNIRQFADEKIRPLVKEMDEKGVFDKELFHEFFQLGLMGIEIPEQYGGGGGRFFEAILAVEELSRVDASCRSNRRCAKHASQQRFAPMGK